MKTIRPTYGLPPVGEAPQPSHEPTILPPPADGIAYPRFTPFGTLLDLLA